MVQLGCDATGSDGRTAVVVGTIVYQAAHVDAGTEAGDRGSLAASKSAAREDSGYFLLAWDMLDVGGLRVYQNPVFLLKLVRVGSITSRRTLVFALCRPSARFTGRVPDADLRLIYNLCRRR
jgi:hypothetical protein